MLSPLPTLPRCYVLFICLKKCKSQKQKPVTQSKKSPPQKTKTTAKKQSMEFVLCSLTTPRHSPRMSFIYPVIFPWRKLNRILPLQMEESFLVPFPPHQFY